MGTRIAIQGRNFEGATAVRFNGVDASFSRYGNDEIEATVPTGATSGPITVVTPAGTAQSAASFTVTLAAQPVVTGFTPAAGRPGRVITVNGSNLTGATLVGFGGVSATFTVTSDAALVASVPMGARTGQITVSGPGGTGRSQGIFTVAPVIESFNPNDAAVGSIVSLRGFNFTGTTARIFHLGYLMLLDEMDRLLPDGRTVASRVLEKARAQGLVTTVDIVSTENPNFRAIAEAALPFTDYLLINEIEAGKVVGSDLRDVPAMSEAARALLTKGVARQVVIHFEKGAVVADVSGEVVVQGSLKLPPDFIVGATGAGDAFAAGYLFGIHEEMPTQERLRLAMCTAAACLTHPTPSMGLRSVAECLRYADEFGFRDI